MSMMRNQRDRISITITIIITIIIIITITIIHTESIEVEEDSATTVLIIITITNIAVISNAAGRTDAEMEGDAVIAIIEAKATTTIRIATITLHIIHRHTTDHMDPMNSFQGLLPTECVQ